MNEKETKTNDVIAEKAEPKTNDLPEHVMALLEAHIHAIRTLIDNQTEKVEYMYNPETPELQFLTKITFEPTITTDNPINYQEDELKDPNEK